MAASALSREAVPGSRGSRAGSWCRPGNGHRHCITPGPRNPDGRGPRMATGSRRAGWLASARRRPIVPGRDRARRKRNPLRRVGMSRHPRLVEFPPMGCARVLGAVGADRNRPILGSGPCWSPRRRCPQRWRCTHGLWHRDAPHAVSRCGAQRPNLTTADAR